MNFRILRVTQMVSVARHLVGPARPVVLALPGGQVVVAQLEALLLLVTTPSSERAQQILALDKLLLALDFLHDRLLRGLFLLLGGLAELADDVDLAKAYRALQARLIPEGLAGVNRTYLEEAAAAESIRSRLLAGDAELLARISMPGGGTLDDVVTRLADTGRELREHDMERAELRATDKRMSVAVVGEARRTFSRIMGHLLSTLDFHEASAEVRDKLLSKLTEAISAAEERQRRQRAGVEEIEEDVLPLVSEPEPSA